MGTEAASLTSNSETTATCFQAFILISVLFLSMCSCHQPTCLNSPPKLQSMRFQSIPHPDNNLMSFLQPQEGGNKGEPVKVSFFFFAT